MVFHFATRQSFLTRAEQRSASDSRRAERKRERERERETEREKQREGESACSGAWLYVLVYLSIAHVGLLGESYRLLAFMVL